MPNISPATYTPSVCREVGAINEIASTVVDAGKSKSPALLNVACVYLSVLLCILRATQPYVVNNSPYTIHGFPDSDKSSFERLPTE